MPTKYKKGISIVEIEMNIQQNSQTLNVQFDDLGGNFLRKKFSMVVILQIYKFLPTRPRKTVYTKLNAINTTISQMLHLKIASKIFSPNFKAREENSRYSPDPLPSMSISMFWDILLFREEKRMKQ